MSDLPIVLCDRCNRDKNISSNMLVVKSNEQVSYLCHVTNRLKDHAGENIT